MKSILTFLLLAVSVAVMAQERIGVYDKSVHATEILEIDADSVVVGDTSTYPLDMAYIEWSADGVSFSKGYNVGDTYLRYSGFSKTSWDTIRVYIGLWTLNGDTIVAAYPNVDIDSLYVQDRISSPVYFLGADTLSHTNMYNGGDGNEGDILVLSGDTAIWIPFAEVGETNLMENSGTRGVGVFDNKTDSTFHMRNVASLSDLLTVTLNSADSVIDLDLALKTIYAGTALSGGGNMEGDVTINLYIPELLETTVIDKDDDYLVVYDDSEAGHRKVNPQELMPDIYVDNIKVADNASLFNFKASDGITILGDANGNIQFASQTVELDVDSVLAVSQLETLNLVAGTNITLTHLGDGTVLIESSGGSGSLPICTEGEFLAYVGGEWTCVSVCDYICVDTIVRIINDWYDTITTLPSGDVYVVLNRQDCLDSINISPSDFVSTTFSLSGIIINTSPQIGTLTYGGDSVIGGDTLLVVAGTFDGNVYYVSSDIDKSAYMDAFSFSPIYTSNPSGSGTFNISVSVMSCSDILACGGSSSYGGANAYPQTDSVDVGVYGGYALFDYIFGSLPDRAIISVDDSIAYETGYVGRAYPFKHCQDRRIIIDY